jgi:hypothetical protein
MADDHDAPLQDFKPWPPADLLGEIKKAWESQSGRNGKHWGLQVYGKNPLSGYMVKVKKCDPGDL